MEQKLEIVVLILLSFFFAWLIYDTGPPPTILGWHTTIYPPSYIAKAATAFILFIILSWRILFLFFDRDN